MPEQPLEADSQPIQPGDELVQCPNCLKYFRKLEADSDEGLDDVIEGHKCISSWRAV